MFVKRFKISCYIKKPQKEEIFLSAAVFITDDIARLCIGRYLS